MPRRFAPRNDSGGGAIAPHVLATADTWQISACHCEPVRTLVRQSASPQGNGASWLLFRQIRYAFRICPKDCFSVLCYRRRTDCRVAPLLAMTCRNLPRVRACKDALPGKPVTAYVFAQGAACFLLPLRGCGLPRRGAAAPLLAMTGRNLPGVCGCQGALPVYCRKPSLYPQKYLTIP